MKFKNLSRYRTGGTASNMRLSIPPPKTPSGGVYRYSPNEAAPPRHFVLGEHDPDFTPNEELSARMKLEPRSKQTVCPYSGVVAPDEEFNHPDDLKAVLEIVRHAAMADIRDSFAQMFKGLERKSARNSFVTFKSTSSPPPPKPRFSRRDLLRELVCDHCSRDYGVYAISLFCPDCGAPNVRLHFAREAQLVSAQVDMAESIEEGGEELAYRLLGNAHEDVLTAFEATLKVVYLYGMAAKHPDISLKPVGNAFQNLEKAAKRFKDLDLDPFEQLSSTDREALALNIQIRHIIGHNLGVIDEKFTAQIENARLGETIELVGEDIRRFAAIAQHVVDRLDAWLAGTPSPNIGIELETAPSPTRNLSKDENMIPEVDINLSPLARRIGVWIARSSANGLRHPINQVELLKEFGVEDGLEEAVAELASEGLVIARSYVDQRLPHLRPTVDLFVVFDPMAIDSDPVTDAASLAQLILNGSDSVDVAALHAATRWPLRRYNPAIALIIAEVDENRVSKELNATYPAGSFILGSADRVELKRFLKRRTQNNLA